MDIILHCLDPGQLKTKGLQDVFPVVCKFNQVSHCPATRRIAGNCCEYKYSSSNLQKSSFLVGASNGSLTLYELRQTKCTTISAHSAAITAAAFSPDGKYLVSYACGENKLCFWQSSTGKYEYLVYILC